MLRLLQNHNNNINLLLRCRYHYHPIVRDNVRWSLSIRRRYMSSSKSDVVLHSQSRSSKIRKAITIVGTFGILVTSSSLYYTHYYFDGVEGIQRAISFYSLAIPKYILYRYHQYIQSPNHIWEELDQQTSQQGLQKILQLKGFYIKCGQMCAANIGNAFPIIWQDTMSILQDQVPYEDFNTVILPILQQELPNYQDIFTYVDPIPIGSASIGQVHRAKMIVHNQIDKSSSSSSTTITTKDVVIKICYPHVERLLRGDVRTIRTFCEIAQPVHVPAMKEVEKQFVTEFDYVQESNNLYSIRQNLIAAKLCSGGNFINDTNAFSNNNDNTIICTVPYPYRQYCTKRILVMEELHGEKLVDVLKRDGQRWMEMAATSRVQQQEEQEQQSLPKRISTEEYDQYLKLMDTSRRIQNIRTRIYNTTIGWWYDQKQYPYIPISDLPLNPSKLVDDLLYIHGHQVLVNGQFNADCHPGNFLLCRKSNGTPYLGLIDFGQVKTLTKDQRHLLCRIIIALANEDKELVVQLMQEAGFQSKYMNPDVIYLYAKVSYDEDNKELTNGKHIQLFMEDIQNMDPIIHLPTDYIMVGRASILLRGLAHMLQQSRSVAKSWKPLAEHVLEHDL